MRKLTVECKLRVQVEIEDDTDAEFVIEENGCPGTGVVGLAIMNAIRHGEEHSTCWACALRGENRIIEES